MPRDRSSRRQRRHPGQFLPPWGYWLVGSFVFFIISAALCVVRGPEAGVWPSIVVVLIVAIVILMRELLTYFRNRKTNQKHELSNKHTATRRGFVRIFAFLVGIGGVLIVLYKLDLYDRITIQSNKKNEEKILEFKKSTSEILDQILIVRSSCAEHAMHFAEMMKYQMEDEEISVKTCQAKILFHRKEIRKDIERIPEIRNSIQQCIPFDERTNKAHESLVNAIVALQKISKVELWDHDAPVPAFAIKELTDDFTDLDSNINKFKMFTPAINGMNSNL